MRLAKFFSLLIISVVFTQSSLAQTNGTWTALNTSNWSATTSWAGGVVATGGGTVFINDFSGNTTGTTLTIDTTSRQIGEIQWNSAFSMTINSSGGASLIVGSSGLTLNSVRSLTNSPITTFVSNSISAQITGTGDLIKTGNGLANLGNATNSFTGTVRINQGLLWNNTGSDGAYGNAANTIRLNGGIMGIATTAVTSTRTIFVDSESRFRLFAALNLNTADQLRGSATLGKDGGSLLTIGNANANFTGGLNVFNGSVTLNASGSLGTATTLVDLAGAVNLTNNATAVNNRLGGRSINARGGDINLTGRDTTATAVSEVLGTFTTQQGQTFLTVTPGAGSTAATDLTLTNLVRNNNAVVFMRGTSLGQASGANVGNVYVTNSPGTQIGGGTNPLTTTTASILPWVWGQNVATGTIGASFVNWDSTSQRIIPLDLTLGYNTNINTATATENVNLTGAAESVAAPVTVNALRLGLATGTTQAVTGSPISITSGAILSSSSLATAPVVTVANDIAAGTAELMIYSTAGTSTVTPNLQLTGALSGSAGLTRSGSGSLLLSGNNTYTGTTTFNGGTTIVSGSTVSEGSPSVFGQSGDIVLNGSGGTVRVWTNGNLVINRNVVARLGHAGTLGIGTAGASTNESVVINGNINLVKTNESYFGNFLSMEGGDTRPEALTVNGVISGAGGLRGTFGSYTILNGNNTYTGGTIIGSSGFATGSGLTFGTQGETWEVGNNNAFGTGTIIVQNFLSTTSNVPAPGTLVAGGGPRTISNPVETISGYLRTAGSNPLTLSGNVMLNGSAQGTTSIDVGANAPLTISGVISNGGIAKSGAGTLTLTGTNTYSGRTVIRQGTISVPSIGNAGVAGPLGQSPSTSSILNSYIILGGNTATDTGTLQYTGSGESTNRQIQISGYGGGIDSSGTGPLVFSNTTTWNVTAPIGSLTGLSLISGTPVVTIGNVNPELLAVGSSVTNTNLPIGTTITEVGVNFIRLSNLPTAAATAQTLTVTANPTDYARTIRLTGSNTGANTINPIIGQSGVATNIVKSGLGTWVLAAANTYAGTTTVNGGTLRVTNTTGSGTGTGAVTINSGGRFEGSHTSTGNVAGAVTVNGGGTLAGGNSSTGTGTLILNGGVTFNASSILAVSITDGTTTGLASSGTSTLGPTATPTSNTYLNLTAGTETGLSTNPLFSVNLNNISFVNYQQPHSYRIGQGFGDQSALSITDPARFSFFNLSTGTISIDTFSLTGDAGGNLYLNFTPVPEPMTILAIGLTGLVVGRRLRRRVMA